MKRNGEKQIPSPEQPFNEVRTRIRKPKGNSMAMTKINATRGDKEGSEQMKGVSWLAAAPGHKSGQCVIVGECLLFIYLG